MNESPEIDDAWLAGLGFGHLPAEERESLLVQVTSELKRRVWTDLTVGVSADVAREFLELRKGDPAKIRAWIDREGVDVSEDQWIYDLLVTSSHRFEPGSEHAAALADWMRDLWIAHHHPERPAVVRTHVAHMEHELRARVSVITTSSEGENR